MLDLQIVVCGPVCLIFKSWFVDFEFPDENGRPYRSSGGEMVWNEELGKEIPEKWKINSIDQHVDFLNGLPLQKYPPKSDKYLPVIKIREMKQGITNSSDRADPNIPKEYIIHDGDVIFSWSGSLEIVIWADGNGALNQHLFKVTSKIFPKWFYYCWIVQYMPKYKHIAASKRTTMGHIQKHHLSKSIITIPDNTVFQKMDLMMSSLMEKIIQTKLNLKNLIQIRDSVLPKLMSGKIRI